MVTLYTQSQACPPPPCLHPSLPQSGADFSAKLQAAGFRADRLSVWGLQGLAGVEDEALTAALVNIANLASYHSLVIGELGLPGKGWWL